MSERAAPREYSIERADGPGRAIITGAAGFIGAAVAGRLAALGWDVLGIDDERTGDWARVDPSIARVDRDLSGFTEDEFAATLDGADVLYHLAAEKYNSSRATPEQIVAVNIAATRRLFAAAGRAGVAKTVFTSSLYAYGSTGPDPMSEGDIPRPTTMYGVSKLAGEHFLRVAERDDGLRWTVARLFFIYGPRQHASGGYKNVIQTNFERLRSGGAPVVHGTGEQALDYVFLDDCIDALLAMGVAGHHGKTFNVASGSAISVNELTRKMLDVVGSTLEPIHDAPDWTEGTRRIGTTELTASELGWRAMTPFEEGLRAVWGEMT